MRAALILVVALMIWVPIGLIPPGGAYAEDESASPAEVAAALEARAQGDSSLFDALPDVNQECACVPNKISDIGFAGDTFFAGYQPPWVDSNDAAWIQNVGYQIAGLAGIGLLAVLGLGMWQFARWLMPGAPPDWRSA